MIVPGNIFFYNTEYGSLSLNKHLYFHFYSKETSQEVTICVVCEDVLKESVTFMCGHRSCKQCVSSAWDQSGSQADHPCPTCQQNSDKGKDDNAGNSLISEAKMRLKRSIKNKFTLISEGNGDHHSSLQSIYTTLYITTGENEGPNGEHEFRHLKHKLKKQSSFDSSVNLNDIFKLIPDQEKPHRTVLTKGVAGIGKSFAVQKFSLDWAEKEANQHVDFVFNLPFRVLNLSKGEKSLHDLLTEFHPAFQPLEDSEDYAETKIIVILDGLDESKLQLDFKKVKTVRSLKDKKPVGDLLVNLIQGKLLPDANLWITSRPAAANQIPGEYLDMVTEIRGFTDPQKEEYFRRRFSKDSGLAGRITSHVQSSQSLDIMCQIPIFCWISAVLFQDVFGENEETEIPQTLTEMMAHFLLVQTKRRSRIYDKKTGKHDKNLLKTHRKFLLKLGKLAFVHLQENKLLFYEEDLEDCGIDVKEATVYSGFWNMVLREEEVCSQKNIFFFVHLTVQEFFAALYVYDCFTTNTTEDLGNFLNLEDKGHSFLDLVKMTVDKVLEKKNGHLDFFLRFLLGLMVESNRRVLQGLLTPLDPNEDTEKKLLTYLRSMRRKTLSPDSCINIFQTMVEMRDHKVKDEIQEYLKMSDRSKTELTPLHCSALAYMLQVSKDELEELDLKSYNTTDEGRRRLIPAVRSSKKAVLKDCKVTLEWVKLLAFGLKFPCSPLRDLDLSNNDLKDSGVEKLCKGLSSQNCRLKILRLSGCFITAEGCAFLASALKSNPSHLVELDLSYNHPGGSGMKLLSELRENQQYKLSKLNFEKVGDHRLRPGLKKYACGLTLDPNSAHKNLLLSDGNRKVTWVKEEQQYPDHAERFDHFLQVLCEQGFKERCYFEVETVEPFSIGLTYRNISRKGNVADCRLGQNEKSWSMTFTENAYSQHRNESIQVACLRSTRVGVYLDWEAATISFYRVSQNSSTRLHTFRAESFSDALYPAVGLSPQTYALFCQ
ncbi:NACHT, LRR and PYD domains-containing protein 12-like [Kryptolebias marmoratus]|uniref:NACHT, LRR and PYD domains-containing protein 12-like n=1 Tax=Kryptolebias marmoratus TaxID=37003 RepID=UPI0007F87A54|nr:NACHT, LRR and PYD domains-containing protein 12-like [Kryptolebias marmoratus]